MFPLVQMTINPAIPATISVMYCITTYYR